MCHARKQSEENGLRLHHLWLCSAAAAAVWVAVLVAAWAVVFAVPGVLLPQVCERQGTCMKERSAMEDEKEA